METFNAIALLEDKLKAFITLKPREDEYNCWNMSVQLFYEGVSAGATEFSLRGFTQQQAEQVARNINQDAYLMREIDEYLWGESD